MLVVLFGSLHMHYVSLLRYLSIFRIYYMVWRMELHIRHRLFLVL